MAAPPSSGRPKASTTRPSSASPTGARATSPVPRTVSAGGNAVAVAQQHAADGLLAEIDHQPGHAGLEHQQLVQPGFGQPADRRDAVADAQHPPDPFQAGFGGQLADPLAALLDPAAKGVSGRGRCRRASEQSFQENRRMAPGKCSSAPPSRVGSRVKSMVRSGSAAAPSGSPATAVAPRAARRRRWPAAEARLRPAAGVNPSRSLAGRAASCSLTSPSQAAARTAGREPATAAGVAIRPPARRVSRLGVDRRRFRVRLRRPVRASSSRRAASRLGFGQRALPWASPRSAALASSAAPSVGQGDRARRPLRRSVFGLLAGLGGLGQLCLDQLPARIHHRQDRPIEEALQQPAEDQKIDRLQDQGRPVEMHLSRRRGWRTAAAGR